MRSNKLFTIAIAALFVLALARLELSLAAPIEHEDPDEVTARPCSFQHSFVTNLPVSGSMN